MKGSRVVGMVLWLWSACVWADPVRISTGEWPPLIDSSAPGDGPLARVVREAFAQQGIEVEFVFLPWRRALWEVESGAVPLSMAWRHTPARDARFLFSSENVYQGENLFFYNRLSRFDWKSLDDLARYRLGGVRGYAYSDAFDEAARSGKLNVFRVNDEKSLIAMLLAGRIDAFPADRQVGRNLIYQYAGDKADQIGVHPLPLTRKPLYLVGSRTDAAQQLMSRFDEGLRQLKASGRFREIYMPREMAEK